MTPLQILTSRVGVVVARLTCNEKVIRSIRVRGKIFATTQCIANETGDGFTIIMNFYNPVELISEYRPYCVLVPASLALAHLQLSKAGYYSSLGPLRDTLSGLILDSSP